MSRCALMALCIANCFCVGCFAPVDEGRDEPSMPGTEQWAPDGGSAGVDAGGPDSGTPGDGSVDGGAALPAQGMLYGVARKQCERGVVQDVAIALAPRLLDCGAFTYVHQSATHLASLRVAAPERRTYLVGQHDTAAEGFLIQFGRNTDTATSGTVRVDSITQWFFTGHVQAVFDVEAPTDASFLAVWCPPPRPCF